MLQEKVAMSQVALSPSPRSKRLVQPKLAGLNEHFVLENVTWDLYEMLLKATRNRVVYITYYDGTLELMTPLPSHEIYKTLLGRMIEILAFELDIPVAGLGSTTYKKKKRLSGLEPDECYYVQNEAKIRGKKRLDLEKDPPPDLAIEVDITHRAIKRELVYARLGVPEILRLQRGRLECLALSVKGTYEPCEMSMAFPGLRVAALEQFLGQAWTLDQTHIVRNFWNWAKKNVRP